MSSRLLFDGLAPGSVLPLALEIVMVALLWFASLAAAPIEPDPNPAPGS